MSNNIIQRLEGPGKTLILDCKPADRRSTLDGAGYARETPPNKAGAEAKKAVRGPLGALSPVVWLRSHPACLSGCQPHLS